MSRQYADLVEVRLDASQGVDPSQFVWRGRLYVVRSVLAHWVEAGAWWRQRAADGLPITVDPTERQVWRVEARPGRSASLGVFDLAYDGQARAWFLARTHD
jgi:hypothetical protein